MAKRVVAYTVLIDDLDGTELSQGEGQTIRYGWKGTEYEIDLSDKHATDLDTMMSNLVSKSVKVGKMLPHRPTTPKRPAIEKPKDSPTPAAQLSSKQQMLADRQFRGEIRRWARQNGYPDLPPSGRLPATVREAWNAAHPDNPAPEETRASH